ncbi:SusD/RagB family nutrient-binding outer membrane lipoprotein [Rasiella sp. SM2506]|uniref:SusD/RagB family nutrient-binding outer membrane lipoprotein n=1 Tax=Rasiella sp. SM2506 TaxID=3423914 RepID=UPI003D7AF7EE
MKNLLKITLLSGVIALFASCETSELELLVSPNDVTTDNADPNFVLNDIQLTFNTVVGGYDGSSRAIVRQINLFDSYSGAVSNTTLNTSFSQSYQMFSNIDLLQGINDVQADNGGIPYHVGVAQIIEAYAYMLLVDYLDEVPFSEAVQPSEFPNPNLDSGAAVYAAQLELLDAAIANLNLGDATQARIPDDLYFQDFDTANWINVANTLKLRAYLNTGNVAGFNAAAASNIIDQNDEDFQFQYSTATNPSSTHPFFGSSYGSAGAGARMSNNLFDFMNVGDAQQPFPETDTPVDPRARYYFYRQTSNAPTGNDIPCEGVNIYDYCYVGNAYWGRDHADNEGLPNDGLRRTAYGIYPGGGAFDADQATPTPTVASSSESLAGAGIRPIFLASFTHFTLAEAALTIGANGNPRTLLETGIRRSMNKVRDFAGTADNGAFEMTDADINNYVNSVLTEYDAANANGKLAVVSKEYFLAAWGNGVEPYNLYRRTGLPDLQAPVTAAGAFPRSFQYPLIEVDGNPNIQQRSVLTKVFWDTRGGDNLD